MKKLNVCVYAICKNEVKFVDSWVESMSEADMIVVTDTGSTDGTVERLRELGVTVYEEVISPWRFDVARNTSLMKVPFSVDICVCTDLDELFTPGWRAQVEEAWFKSIELYPYDVRRNGKYLYNWSLKSDGSPDVQFYYNKIHERVGFQWKCPVHEYLDYIANERLITVDIPDIELSHYPDASKSRGSYLGLLEMAVEENKTDIRMKYYLGREYMYLSKWELCIKTCVEYLDMPESNWSDERCAAMRCIAKSYGNLGETDLAYEWYFKAIGELPTMREAYVEFAKLCAQQKNWPLAYYISKSALKITEKSNTYVNEGFAWDFTLDDICSMASYYLGIYEEALEHAKKALDFEPENKRLQENYNVCKEIVNL